MRPLSILVLLSTAGLLLAQNPIRYHVAFPNRNHHEAEISVTFREIPFDTLQVRMSRTSPGRYALHEFSKNVYNVRAVDGKGRALTFSRPNLHQWNIAGHDGTVKISYTIFGDHVDGTYLGVDNTHAHLNAPAAFIWARGLASSPVEVTFDLADTGWRVATQLQPDNTGHTFRAPDLAHFLDSPIEIAAFEMREWPVPVDSTQTVRFALHHEGSAAELDAYVEPVKGIVAEALALFGEAPRFDFGTYTFIADYLPQVHGDGMEHRNSTVLTSASSLREKTLLKLGAVSHEFIHAWNVERLRPHSLEPFDFEAANVSGELWFAEGVTNYYDALLLHRAGAINIDHFSQAFAAALNTVLNGPGRALAGPAAMSRRAPFVDAGVSIDRKNLENTFISYYTYGSVIGLALDLSLRTQFSNVSLDDLMRRAWQKFGKSEIPYDNDDLRDLLAELTSPAFAGTFFRDYIFASELPDIAAMLRAGGFVLRKSSPGEAWIGFATLDFSGDHPKVAKPTRIGSPLYRAGLDLDDEILEFDGMAITNQDALNEILEASTPGQMVALKFRKNGEEREAKLKLQENPELELVPFEHTDEVLTQEILVFRENWLGAKSRFVPASLRRFCPECRRDFQFSMEYCSYDGEALELTRPDEKGH